MNRSVWPSSLFLGTVLLIAVVPGCFSSQSHSDIYIYVSNEDSNDISVISSASHEVVATIPVGKRPRGIRVSPDGGTVFIALSGSPKCPPTMADDACAEMAADKTADGIAEVDIATWKVVRVLPSGSDPEQFDINWDTGRLYVSNEDIHAASILDLASGELLKTVPTGREPEGVRVSPDGSIVYVTGEEDGDVTVLDAASGKVITRIRVGLRPRDAVFTADGTTAYVSVELSHAIAVIDVANHSVSKLIRLQDTDLPMGLALSRDERRLYVTNGRGRTVSAIDPATGTVIATLEAGTRPWGLALSPDGRYLYSANGPSNDITVIETATFTITTRITVGKSPWGVAVASRY